MTYSKLGKDRDTGQLVYLPRSARTQGLYIIGLQGVGKSGLSENLIVEDCRQGLGVCVLDPHGELVDNVIARLPSNREKDVILLDITDEDYPFGLNLFVCPNLNSPKEVQKTVDRILHVFEKLLGVSHDTPLILQYLRNCTYTLIVNPGYTMAEIPLLLQDERFRNTLVANVSEFDVRLFWKRYEEKRPSDREAEAEGILRRVSEFLQPMTSPIVGQSTTTLDLQKFMDEGKILLVKLSRQLEQATTLIGSLFVALMLNAAYARPKNKRRQFHLYADEFQNFATEDFAILLEEARKFAIGTTIAHQNRGQLNSANSKLEIDLKDRTRSVRNMVVFQINGKDAEDLANEFDHSPLPGEPRLENITEPVFDEWDEEVWDSEELKAEYLAIPEKIASLRHIVVELCRGVGVEVETTKFAPGHRIVIKPDFLQKRHFDLFERALSMTPEEYASKEIVKGFNSKQHPVFFLLPNPKHKQVLQYLLENIYSYPGSGRMSWMSYNLKSTKDLLAVLDNIATSDLGYEIFTYPLRNKRAERFTLPSNIPSIIEISLQWHWWKRTYNNTGTLAAKQDKERSEALANELSFEKRAALSEALLHEVQEVLNPIKEQVIYTHNPSFNVEIAKFPDRRVIERSWIDQILDRTRTELHYSTERHKKYISEEKGLSKWGEAWNVNFEVLMPVLRWIHQRILSCWEEINTLVMREIDLWHEHRRIVPHKVYLHERTVYDYIGTGSKYRDYDQAMPKQRRVSTEIPSSEVLNRVANELSHPKQEYTARVRIAVNIPENPGKKCFKCGFPNKYGAVLCGECETPLPAPNEYTITTIDPKEFDDLEKNPERKPLWGRALQERMTRIQTNNRHDRYVRKREEVEAEITKRRTGFSGGFSPTQTKQPPNARQVPLCPNCGKSNPRESQFCNQCGTQL